MPEQKAQDHRSDEDLLILAEMGDDEDLARLSDVDRERAITLLGQAVERDKKIRARQVQQLTQATHDRLLHPATYLNSPQRKRQPEPEQAKGQFRVESFFDPASPVAGDPPPKPPTETGIPFSEFSNKQTMDVPTEFEQAGFGRNTTGSAISAADAAIDESKTKFLDSIMATTLGPDSFLPTSRGQAGSESIMRRFDEETGELDPEIPVDQHVQNLAQGFAPVRFRTRRPGEEKLPTVDIDENGNELVQGVGSAYEATSHLIGMQMRGGKDAPTYRYSREILEIGQMFGYFLDWDMMDTETTQGVGTLGFWEQDPRQGPEVNPEWNRRGHAYALDVVQDKWLEQTDPFRVAKKAGGAAWTLVKGAATGMGFLGRAVVPEISQDDPSQRPRLVRSKEHEQLQAGAGFVTDLAVNILSQIGDNLNDMREDPQEFAEEHTTEAMDIIGIGAGTTGLGLRTLGVIPKHMKGAQAVSMLQGYAALGPDGMSGAVVVHEAAKYLRVARKEAARLVNKGPKATGITENVRAMQHALGVTLDSGDGDEFLDTVRRDVVDTVTPNTGEVTGRPDQVVKSADAIPAEQATAKALVGEAAHDSPELLDVVDEELDRISRGYLDGIEFLNRIEEKTPEVQELLGDLRAGYVRRTKMKEALVSERAVIEETTQSIENILLKAEKIIADPKVHSSHTTSAMAQVLLELQAAATEQTQGMGLLRRLLSKYEKETGKKIGLVAAAGLLPYALYGEEAQSTEKLASLGPVFLLAAYPLMPSNKARKEVLSKAATMLGYSAAATVWKLEDMATDAAIVKHMRSDKAIKEAVKLYEELAGAEALATKVIPGARALTSRIADQTVKSRFNLNQMMEEIAKGASGAEWFHRTWDELDATFGTEDADLIVRLIVLTTAEKQPDANLSAAMNLYHQIQMNGGLKKSRVAFKKAKRQGMTTDQALRSMWSEEHPYSSGFRARPPKERGGPPIESAPGPGGEEAFFSYANTSFGPQWQEDLVHIMFGTKRYEGIPDPKTGVIPTSTLLGGLKQQNFHGGLRYKDPNAITLDRVFVQGVGLHVEQGGELIDLTAPQNDARYHMFAESLRLTVDEFNRSGMAKKVMGREISYIEGQSMYWKTIKRDKLGDWKDGKSTPFESILFDRLLKGGPPGTKMHPESHAWSVLGPSVAIGQQSKLLARLAKKNDGAAVHAYTGIDMQGQPGLAVGIYPETKQILDKAPTSRVVADHMNRHKAFLRDPKNFTSIHKRDDGRWEMQVQIAFSKYDEEGMRWINENLANAKKANPSAVRPPKGLPEESKKNIRTAHRQAARWGEGWVWDLQAGRRTTDVPLGDKDSAFRRNYVEMDQQRHDKLLKDGYAPVRIYAARYPSERLHVPTPVELPKSHPVRKVYESLEAGRKSGASDDPVTAILKKEARDVALPDEAAAQTPEAVNKARGATRTGLLAGMASTSLGAAVGSAALSRAKNGEGGDFGVTGLLLGGAIGFGFSRWLLDPKVRNAVANLRGVPDSWWRSKVWRAPGKAGEPDLEDLFTSIVEPMIPESIPVNAGRVATMATGGAIGAASATAVTSFSMETEPDPWKTALGAGVGIALGVGGSKRVMRTVFNMDFNPRKAFRRFVRSDAGLPSSYFAMKKLVTTRMMGRIQEIRDVSIALDKLGPDVGDMIDDFRRGNRSIDSLPPEAKVLALQFGQIFDRLALDIVEVGIATGQVKETVLSNVGSYLPRLYWVYETDDANRLFEGIVDWARAKNVPLRKLSDQDYIKKRGDELAMPKEYREALGEIRNNPAYLLAKRGVITASDVENRRLMNWLASSEHVVPEVAIPRKPGSREVANYVKTLETPDGTMKELDARAMGSLSATEYRRLQDEIRRAELSGVEEAREIKGTGRYQRVEWNGKRYIKFEDSKKWGPLAGRYVDEDVAMDQMAGRDVPESLARVLIDSGTGLFKTGKVLWNPATLARNIVSNEILADFAGVSPLNIKLYAATRRDFFQSGQDYLDARRGGLFGGEFRQAEINDLLRGVEESDAFGATAISGITKNLQNIIRKVHLNKISFESLERFHEASEQFYKLLVYKHARSTGKSIDEAVAHAKKYIFDYGDVPEWIKLTRRSVFGAPFITFSYKAIPRIIEHAVSSDYKKAWKFWKWIGGMGAVNELSARTLPPEALGRTEPVDTGFIETAKRIVSAGTGIGDPIGYKRWLPDWGGAQQVLIPGVDQWGRARSYDASWTAPWGDLGEFGQGTLGRNLARAGLAWPRFLEPGNPWAHSFVGFLTGKDAFSGQDIFSPGANNGENLVKMVRWQMRLWGPQLINPAGRSAEKLWRAYKEDVGADPFVPEFWSGVASEAGGLKNRTFDPHRSYMFRQGTLRSNVGDMEAEWRNLRRKGAPRETLRRKKADIARARAMFYSKFGRPAPASNEALEAAIQEATRGRIERSEAAPGENWFMRALGVTGEGDNE